MSGPLHRIARLVRLGLAALALAAAVVPAQALPMRLTSAVTLSVVRLVHAPQRARAAPSVWTEQGESRAFREHRGTWASAPRPASRPEGPPRRLFLAHRALLR